jgi:hypothetical protein
MDETWPFKSNLFGCYLGLGTITSVSESTVVVASVVAVASMVVEEVESLEIVDTL